MTDSTLPAKTELVLHGQKVELIFDGQDADLGRTKISAQEAITSFIRSLLKHKQSPKYPHFTPEKSKDFLRGLHEGTSYFPASFHVDPRIQPHLDSIQSFYFKPKITRSTRRQISRRKRDLLGIISTMTRNSARRRRRMGK